MKKLILILFLVVLFATVAVNAGILLIQMDGVEVVGGSAVNISDNFDTDPGTRWTDDIETWGYNSGSKFITSSASGGSLTSYDTTLGTVNGYAIVKLDPGAGQYPGIYFRFDGNISNAAYTVRSVSDSGTAWRECTGGVSCTDVNDGTPATWANVFDTNDYMGITWEGTGNNTIVKCWDFGASLPGDPTDPATWGAAGVTWTQNPTAADVGKKVGLYTGNTVTCDFDDFYAGDK